MFRPPPPSGPNTSTESPTSVGVAVAMVMVVVIIVVGAIALAVSGVIFVVHIRKRSVSFFFYNPSTLFLPFFIVITRVLCMSVSFMSPGWWIF